MASHNAGAVVPNRGQTILARSAWAVAAALLGVAGISLLIYVPALIVETSTGDSSLRELVEGGFLESGFAAGLGIIAVRPVVEVNRWHQRVWLAAATTAMAFPILVGSFVWSGVTLTSGALALIVTRTLVGAWLATEMLFAGRFGIVDNWYGSLRKGLFLGFGLSVWLVFLLPTRSFDDVPLAALIGVWALVLLFLAVGAFRFYTQDQDLEADRGWRFVIGSASFLGLVLGLLVALTS